MGKKKPWKFISFLSYLRGIPIEDQSEEALAKQMRRQVILFSLALIIPFGSFILLFLFPEDFLIGTSVKDVIIMAIFTLFLINGLYKSVMGLSHGKKWLIKAEEREKMFFAFLGRILGIILKIIFFLIAIGLIIWLLVESNIKMLLWIIIILLIFLIFKLSR